MGKPLTHEEILQQFDAEELEEEYDWHRGRGKTHWRNQRYGLYWWHQKHCAMIMQEIARRELYEPGAWQWEQLAFDAVEMRNTAPENRK